MNNVKFVAEVSSNHNRDLSRCKLFIETAAEIGCSAVKFQLFKIDQLFAPEILLKSKTHRDRKLWELPVEFIPELANYCHSIGLEFSCTPFYLQAVEDLEPYVDFFKIASYELLWKELFIKCVETGKPLVFSTGMAKIKEIKNALTAIWGYNTIDITILKCTSAYPTPYYEANLSVINTLETELKSFEKQFNLSIGYSDHTVSPSVIYRAVHHYGCKLIEFHLDIDGKGEEYKAGHCWLPDQIKEVIDNIKMGFEADGAGIIGPTKSEMDDRNWRTDPEDGLRPIKHIRSTFIGD